MGDVASVEVTFLAAKGFLKLVIQVLLRITPLHVYLDKISSLSTPNGRTKAECFRCE